MTAAASMMNSDPISKRAAFQKLHESGCFVIPNPWNIGTARYLEHLGFPALATTSAGFAFSQGLPDADWAVPRDSMLSHIAELVTATRLPVNADFESGYAHEPESVARNVELCLATGIAGLSIEDATGDPRSPLYDLELAVERIRAARSVIDKSGTGVLLTGRTECFLTGHSEPLKESVRRLEAYAGAGADALYAPGAQKREEIQAIVAVAGPKPVNVLMSTNNGLTVPEVAEMGVRRISTGSSLARTAWTGFVRAAREIAEQGSFAGFDGMIPFAELNGFFQKTVTKSG